MFKHHKSIKTYNARRGSRTRRHFPILAISIIVCVIAVLSLANVLSNTINPAEHQQEAQIAGRADLQEIPSNLQINSTNALLIDLESGRVLFDRDSTARIYPASMTKIMTAVVALENLNDLNESIVLNKEVFYYIARASTAGFSAGEQVGIDDLLYGLLLPSGAECAVGLANRVAGSENEFADLMNDKAQSLGMSGTHFTNATGLHDENQYSTAEDISLLLKYALKNDTFYKIFTTARYSTKPTNLHEGGITFYSTMFSKMDNPDFGNGSILGGKTGYTEEAGLCLASLAEKNGNRYILVTCGAQGKGSMDSLHISDAFTVYSAIR